MRTSSQRPPGCRDRLLSSACVCADLIDLAPDLTDDLLNTVDQPLQLAKDSKGNSYLLCDYNRDGDSYRCQHLCLMVPAIMCRTHPRCCNARLWPCYAQVAVDQCIRPATG